MGIIDISPPLSGRRPNWPGDRAFESGWTLEVARGDSCNVAHFATSCHAGAHVDAPRHFLEEGATVDEVPLGAFLGPAEVVDARGAPSVLETQLSGIDTRLAPRILFRTDTHLDKTRFPASFASISAGAARLLAEEGAVLAGIDTPSVDPVDSKGFEAHRILARSRVQILEGLDLSMVPPGRYELVALPLRLEGLDASPVRAVLVERDGRR
ncbi:MAG: cyclase family protein [Methanobacteriota archaeon]